MPVLYSSDWVAAFNAAVADMDAAAVDTGASLAADRGSFRVDQVLRGAPGGELRVTLEVVDGRLRLNVGEPDGPAADDPPDVTVTMDYADAAAMSRGQLDPADALGAGRIRVRGDLAVLVASQALLAAASERLGPLQAETTS
ncbi:MAG: SCP2 sterol-binding domain-containing protein [Acidimicrobiales bacterium]